REKARKLLAKHHQNVRRQRRDFHYKTALALVRQYDVVSLEDLQVATLVQNRHLSKSIIDAGWAEVRTNLAYKAACTGRHVILLPPASTSQESSGCGTCVARSPSVRTPVCSSCGLVLNRDANAANNVLKRAPMGL